MQHADLTTRNDPLMLTPETSRLQAWIPIEKIFRSKVKLFSNPPYPSPVTSILYRTQKPPRLQPKSSLSLLLPQTFHPLQKNIPKKSSEILPRKRLYNG